MRAWGAGGKAPCRVKGRALAGAVGAAPPRVRPQPNERNALGLKRGWANSENVLIQYSPDFVLNQGWSCNVRLKPHSRGLCPRSPGRALPYNPPGGPDPLDSHAAFAANCASRLSYFFKLISFISSVLFVGNSFYYVQI